INDGGNSGVFVRWLEQDRPSYEAEIKSTDPDPNRTGSIYRGKYPVAKSYMPPPRPGEWFTEETIVDGNHVTVLGNGKETAEYHDKDRVPRGRIALQVLLYQTVVEFKSIEVKELSASKTAD